MRYRFREKYYVVVSFLYLLIGAVILGRSLIAHVFAVGILGIVFLALGLVRLRDFYLKGERPR